CSGEVDLDDRQQAALVSEMGHLGETGGTNGLVLRSEPALALKEAGQHVLFELPALAPLEDTSKASAPERQGDELGKQLGRRRTGRRLRRLGEKKPEGPIGREGQAIGLVADGRKAGEADHLHRHVTAPGRKIDSTACADRERLATQRMVSSSSLRM